MRERVIKKAVMSASLGLALIFSGQALADIVAHVRCEPDREGRLRVAHFEQSDGERLSFAPEKGDPCVNVLAAMQAAGCVKPDFIEMQIETMKEAKLHIEDKVWLLAFGGITSCPPANP